VVVEGGIGSPAQAAQAMEMGAAAVLVNTAVAQAPDPVRMAAAMKHAVIAGRLAASQRRDVPAAAAG
jgi:thiazole synthase